MNVSVKILRRLFIIRLVLGAGFIAISTGSSSIRILELSERAMLIARWEKIQGVNHDSEHYGGRRFGFQPEEILER